MRTVPFFSTNLSLRAKVLFVFCLLLMLTLVFPNSQAHAAGIVVNSTADTTVSGDTQCTLREAIANANADVDTTGGDCVAGSGTDTITFSGSVLGQTITMAGTQFLLTSSMTINATSSGVTLNGNSASRIFQINSGNTVILTRLTMINGNVVGNGGGIYNSGTLTINESVLRGHTATAFGGGIVNAAASSLTVNNTTIYNNLLAVPINANGGGGGITNSGTMVLNNTTISGNAVTGSGTGTRNGGGIRNPGGTATLNNVTLVNNTAGNNGGGITTSGTGFTMKNSLVANNTAGSFGPDCRGPVLANFSLIRTTTGCTLSGGNNITGLNPFVGPLDANGGGTISNPLLTHVLLDASPALNSGSNATCLTTDARGYARPVGTCDMGAVEKQTGEETDAHCSWASGVPHTFGTDVNITITPNSISDPIACISILKRPVFAGSSQDGGEFPILWTLMATNPTNNVTYDVNIDFCYTDPELATAGVADENSIVIFHLQNGVWQAMSTNTSPSTNCVSVKNITSLSPWTIVGNGNSPTVIELENLTARAVNSPQSMALALIALLGLAVGVLLIRSRK